MTYARIPHFIISNRYQKRSSLFSDILTEEVLKDICERITGCSDYTYEFINDVNVGRLAILKYQDSINYVSLSETSLGGRNSSLQSFPSALVRYHKETNLNKRIFFYFLPAQGSFDTQYFRFMYRLMLTAGVSFLNAELFLTNEIFPFNSVEDIISARDQNRGANKSNNSSYVTKNSNGSIEVYGKTYGANKKETTLLCIALSQIATVPIKLYVICENTLKSLPKPDMEVIESFGRVQVIPTDLTMERNELEKNNSLRSPRYIYNLLKKLGPKKCTFCECEIPELIQGAHIWPVADIKRDNSIDMESQILYATDGENGIWLCQNHHKLLDENLLTINLGGEIEHKEDITASSKEYILKTTPVRNIPSEIYTEEFITYLKKRYQITA